MTVQHTTDAEIILALRAVKEHGSNRAAGHALGVNASNVDRRVKLAQSRGLTAESPLRDPLEKAKDELRVARAALASVHRQNDTAEAIRSSIYRLRNIDAAPPKWLTKPIQIEGPGTPMLLLSDLHFGEVVRPEEVAGINEFSTPIAEKRLARVIERFIALVRHHMPKGVPGAVIMLGGDMITGDIHQELTDTNDEYVLQTVRRLKGLLFKALLRLADEFGTLYVPCVVGNHGRATLKPRMKGRVHTSYEWNIYTDLEERFQAIGDKRVKFEIAEQTDVLFAVHGHRFLLTHGDALGTKGGDGMIGAIGPIMRGAIKTGKSEAQIGRDFDTIVMGHWHQYFSTRGIIVNNCLKGYDEYAKIMLRAPATPASQAMWFVHRRWGINTAMEVYAQDPFNLDRVKNAPWVSVPGGV